MSLRHLGVEVKILLPPAVCPDSFPPKPPPLELSGRGKLGSLLRDFCSCPGENWGTPLLPQFFTRTVNAEKAKVSKRGMVAVL